MQLAHDVLTVTGWITARPRPIIDILADTQVVPMQCVATVTFVGGSCTYERWSSLLVAHHAICDDQKWTVINYNEGWCHSTIIKCTHGTVTIDTSGMHDIVGRARMRHRLHVSTSIAQELNWQAEGDTHGTTHWPSTPCTQQENWYTYGQLKALITADEWLLVDRATKHKSLLTLLLFLLLSISHELSLAKLHWSFWATCCHCWCAVYIVSIAEDIGKQWHGEMKPPLPSSLPNNSPHRCSYWRDL